MYLPTVQLSAEADWQLRRSSRPAPTMANRRCSTSPCPAQIWNPTQAASMELHTGGGLELAIARGIMETHGGTLSIESGVGWGTRVWFTLPSAGG